MRNKLLWAALACAGAAAGEDANNTATNAVADLGTITVEGTALSRYRPETLINTFEEISLKC